MKHGKFYIDKANLFNYLGLPEDSHVQVKDDGNGIELYVVSEGDNGLLTDKTNEVQHLRKYRVGLGDNIPKSGVEYIIHNGFSYKGKLKDITDEEAIAHVKINQYEGDVALVKTELLYFSK